MVGFYALASAAVERADTPGRVRRNMPDPVPVILLSRLAIDAKNQGQGLGAQLLRDAITRAVAAAEIIGVRALLVHALHEQARAFYAHFDFEPSPTDPLHSLLLIKDARACSIHRVDRDARRREPRHVHRGRRSVSDHKPAGCWFEPELVRTFRARQGLDASSKFAERPEIGSFGQFLYISLRGPGIVGAGCHGEHSVLGQLGQAVVSIPPIPRS